MGVGTGSGTMSVHQWVFDDRGEHGKQGQQDISVYNQHGIARYDRQGGPMSILDERGCASSMMTVSGGVEK